MKINIVVSIEVQYEGGNFFIVDDFDNPSEALERKLEIESMDHKSVFELCNHYWLDAPDEIYIAVFADIVDA